MDPLSTFATASDVENVLLFVSDALRFDFLPNEVRDLGVTAKAIAPSTFTASALPSLLTGQYPTTHGVWMFDDQLASQPPLLDTEGYDIGFDAETVWIELPAPEKPPLYIHHLDRERTLTELDPPFTHVVHDIGPHAPYGFKNGVFESTKAFFRDYASDRGQLVDLYEQDCHNSAARFISLYEQLDNRGLLEETLVVFTSDHGQCLGEPENGGRFGHGHPMVPDTVEIPVVFIGAGLPGDASIDTLVSGTDIVPTVLSAQRQWVPPDVDGVDLWRDRPAADRKLRADVWQHLTVGRGRVSRDVTVYAATSVWGQDGGYVFHRKSAVERLAALTYDNLQRGYAPAYRRNASLGTMLTLARLLLTDSLEYGEPEFSEAVAREVVPTVFDEPPNSTQSTTLNDEQEAQLRDLGYLR